MSGVRGPSYDTQKVRGTYGKTFDSGVDWLVSMTHYSSGGMNFYYPELDQRTSDNPRAANDGFSRGNDDEEAAKFFSSVRYGDFAASLYLRDHHKKIPTALFETVLGDPRTMTDDMRG